LSAYSNGASLAKHEGVMLQKKLLTMTNTLAYFDAILIEEHILDTNAEKQLS